VEVLSGANLIPMDRKTSDPYVTVAYDDDQVLARTKVISDTLNPVWNETLDLPRPPPGSYLLRFTVWDADIGKDDCMGMAELRLAEGIVGPHVLDIVPKPNTKSYDKLIGQNLGHIKVAISDPLGRTASGYGSGTTLPAGGGLAVPAGGTTLASVPPTTLPGGGAYGVVPPPPLEPEEELPGMVDFTVVRAVNLARPRDGPVDPFVAMQFDGQDTFAAKTQTKRNTHNPEYGQSFNFNIPPMGDEYLVMKFIVRDEATDDFLGMAFLTVGMGMDGEHRLTLMPRSGNRADKALKRKNGNTLGLLVVNVKSRLPRGTLPMHESGFESLHVEVMNATGLTASRHDPFVALGFGKRNAIVKTVSHGHDQNPAWNEDFTLKVPPEESSLRVSVMDFDPATSTDTLIGEGHVRLKGNCAGEHELVLHCPGKDPRQNIGRVRVRISGKRLYDYTDEPDFEDTDFVRRESTVYGHDSQIAAGQPISSTILADSQEEKTRRLAEMWRGHEATDTVHMALPLTGGVKEATDAQKKAAYEEHRRLLEESERLRIQQETQAHELAVQRAALERRQLEEERWRNVERQRLQDLASYERVSLKLGGAHSWTDDIALIPRAGHGPTLHHPAPPRGSPRFGAADNRHVPRGGRQSPSAEGGRAPSSPRSGRSAYQSPYAQPGSRGTSQPRPPSGGGAPATAPKPGAKPAAKTAAKNKKDKRIPVPAFRDTTSFMQPSYCQTDYYFARGDPTDIGKRPAKGTLEFEKQSVGKRAPLAPSFMDNKLSAYPPVVPGRTLGTPSKVVREW